METEHEVIDIKQMAYWTRRSERFSALVAEIKELFLLLEVLPEDKLDEAIDLADGVCSELEELYKNAPPLD